MAPIPRSRFVRCAACLCLALVSCSPSEPAASPRAVTISMAASTQEVVEQLAQQFSAQTQIAVTTNTGPSSGLAQQILEGAPADLFLSANRAWAEKLDEAGLAAAMQPLLTNQLVLIVPRGNPAGVRQPRDLTGEKVGKVALAGENVPAGIYADQALAKLGLLDELTRGRKIARGQDVRTALSYVERGEAEAGIVYATDLRAGSQVEQVYAFDPAQHDEIVYVLVLLRRGADNPAAREFYDFLRSGAAQATYARAGFERLPGN